MWCFLHPTLGGAWGTDGRAVRGKRPILEPQIKSNEFSVLTLLEIFRGESLMKFEMIMQFNTGTFPSRPTLRAELQVEHVSLAIQRRKFNFKQATEL